MNFESDVDLVACECNIGICILGKIIEEFLKESFMNAERKCEVKDRWAGRLVAHPSYPYGISL